MLAALWLASVSYAHDTPTHIRVRLLEAVAPQALVVSAEAGIQFYAGNDPDHVLAELSPHEEATIRLRGDEVYVKTTHLSFFALSLQVRPRNHTPFRVEVTEGTAPPAQRHYTGSLMLAVDPAHSALMLINHVPLEDYVAAVVAREYGFDDLEGARAMAVLARTYALRTAGKYGDDYDQVDHLLSQQYDGTDRLTAAAREAVRLTQGEVLTYHDELIEAVYFSSSGGHTANNEDVWLSEPLPYLRGRPDPYDGASPHARWRAVVPRDRLLRTLSRTYGFTVEGFYLGDRSPDGRVQTIELLRTNLKTERIIRSNEFRLFINRHFGKNTLKSTLFDARRQGDDYIFEGSGYGHGVGLSQYGVLEMSKRGFSYREILDYYYTDVEIQHLASTSSEEPIQPQARNTLDEEIRREEPAPVVPVVTAEPEPIQKETSKPQLQKQKPQPKKPQPKKKSSKRRVGW